MDLVKKEYEALNNQLIKELPKLCKMSLDVILNCIIVFNFVKETYLCEWKEHLGEVLKVSCNDFKQKNLLSSFMPESDFYVKISIINTKNVTLILVL